MIPMKRFIILVAASLVLFSGCSVVNDSMRISEKNSFWNPVETLANKKQKSSDEALPPETMAAIWNFAVYEKPGTPSIRGLGGRLYFYDANNNAVKADGELVVYGFDEDSESKSKPDKKFVFRASELQSHYSDSALGGSYSIWIPWDKVGGYRKSVTLLPVFKGTDGRVIRAEQSINLLAGKVKQTSSDDTELPYRVLGSSSAVLGQPSDKRSNSSEIRQASFTTPNTDGDTGEYQSRIRTTAISLTPNLQRQIEIAAQARAGKKPFSAPVDAPELPTAAPATVELETPNAPAARTSTNEGVFGVPGTFR